MKQLVVTHDVSVATDHSLGVEVADHVCVFQSHNGTWATQFMQLTGLSTAYMNELLLPQRSQGHSDRWSRSLASPR
jgi:hypothetical protein